MEQEALKAASTLLLPSSGRRGRAEAVYYYLVSDSIEAFDSIVSRQLFFYFYGTISWAKPVPWIMNACPQPLNPKP